MLDRSDSLTKNKSSEKSHQHIPESASLLAKEFGLMVNQSNQDHNHSLVFSLPTDRSSQPNVVAQGTDIKALREELTKKRDAFIKRIEDEHLVDILVDGQYLNISDTDHKPLKAEVRTPNFSQLTKIENSLQRSLPEKEDKDSGILGWFTELFDNDKTRLVIGLAANDTDTKSSARYFQGDSTQGILPQVVIDPEVRDAESVYLHEFAHHGQAGFWNSDQANSQSWQEYTRTLGWIRSNNRDLRLTNDAQPQFFYSPSENNPHRRWVRVNDCGDFLDEKGNRVNSLEKAYHISNEEMASRALVGPANPHAYMTSPSEHGAEMMMTIRQDMHTRAAFMRMDIHAYKIAVELDQKEIDNKYGVDWSGQSRRIRMPGGEIAENNEESRRELQLWESRNSRAIRGRPIRLM
ncbi:MAG TPA: hypothetical protein PKZ32_00315 [Candidatus Melainabacteria bacterium]|nr:hypothetical protein [Candidatus Melainabacteria bacterium]